MKPRPDDHGIFLRVDRLRAFMGELDLLSNAKQARQLRTDHLNLIRAKQGRRVGDRTITDLMTGTAAIARRRGVPTPTFEDLFEIRLPRHLVNAA